MILTVLSWFVPRPQRRAWLREWRAELTVARRNLSSLQALAFASGALADALHLWREDEDTTAMVRRCIGSPVFCLLALSLAATPATFFALPSLSRIHAVSLGVVAVVTWLLTPRRTWFCAAKLTLGCAALTSLYRMLALVPGSLHSRPTDLGTNVMLDFILLIFFFTAAIGLTRWLIEDEYLRCPRCGRRLSDGITLGNISLPLQGAGRGRLCDDGHGTLFEPVWTPATKALPQWSSL